MSSDYTVEDYIKDHASDMDPDSLMVISAKKVFSGDDAMAGLTLVQQDDGTIAVSEKKDGAFFNVVGDQESPLLQYDKDDSKLWVEDRMADQEIFFPFSSRIEAGDKISSVQGVEEFCCLGKAEKLLRDAMMKAAALRGHGVHDGIMGGLALKEEDGKYYIKEVKRPSPFARKKLKAGDRVYALNGEVEFCCIGKAEKTIRDATHVSIITDAKSTSFLAGKLPFAGLKLTGSGKAEKKEDEKEEKPDDEENPSEAADAKAAEDTKKAAEETERPAEEGTAQPTDDKDAEDTKKAA